jgi:hypothetical protein
MQLPYLLKVGNYNTQAGHAQITLAQSTLALLMAWLGAYHTHHAFTNDDLAIAADLFY